MSAQIEVPGLLQSEERRTGVTVTLYDGQQPNLVVVHFDQPVGEFAPFEPIGAVDIGAKMLANAAVAERGAADAVIKACMVLVDHVYEARGDLKPAGGALKHELTERHRRTLTRRLEVMLNSARENKTKSNHELAKTLVETCLKEVL